MTIIEVVLIGAAVLLIASALDNTPIVSTFQKIISNQPIDWSGNSGSVSASNTGGVSLTPGPGGTLLGPGITLPNPDGSCPTGYHSIRGSAGNLLCQKN